IPSILLLKADSFPEFPEVRSYWTQRFADLRWAGFLPLNLKRSTKLSATTKLSAEHETPPIANVLLPVVVLCFIVSALSNGDT
uniref:hypothetical protein n=1 Tax=Gelidibacter sp. TaxID=2018083 RepID=UPI00404A1022